MSATKEIRMERYFNRAQNRLHAERRHEERGTKASISCWFDIPRMHRPFYENGIPSSFFIFLLFLSLTLPFYRHPTGLFLQPPPPPPSTLYFFPSIESLMEIALVETAFFLSPLWGLHLATIMCIIIEFLPYFFFLHANINARNW